MLGCYMFEAVTEGHGAVPAELAVCMTQISSASSLDGKRCQPAISWKQSHRYEVGPACMIFAMIFVNC